MRKLKLFFACLLMAVLSIGQVWGETYSLVSNAGDLSAGDEIIIVNTAADYAISTTQATNNRTATAVSVSGGKITPGDAVQIITLGEATKNSTTYWTLQPEAGKYLYAAASDKNQMKTKTTLDDNGKWSISISSDGTATITAQGTNRPLMRYNPNNNSPIFACYATNSTTGTLVKIYKKDAPPATTVVAPVFTPNGGNFVGTTSVTITSETENATIYYTMGENPADPTESSTLYTGAIPVSATTTIKAIAAKSGMTTSAVITKTFTKLETKTIAQIMPTSTTEGAEFALNDVTVTYANGKNIYVKDASGYMLVYDNNNAISGAENGKVLNGLWGKAKKYYGLPEISSITKVPSINEGSAVEAEALNAYPTAEDLNKYAILEGVTFASAHTLATSGDIENVDDASYKGSTFTLRNNFKIAATLASGKSYRVLGIVQIYNTTYQVYPITISEILVPAMTVNPPSLDFGTIGVGDAAPAALTFAVSGSNLSANLSASVTAGSDYYDIAVTGSLDKDANNEVDATITVTPKAAINANPGTVNGTVTVTDGGSLSQTVSLTTVVKAKHTVTWSNSGSTSTTQVLDGEKPAFPATPLACDATSTVFVGWATAPWEDKIATLAGKTVYTAASAMPEVTTDDVVYYAVFAKGAGGFDGTAGGDFYIYADIENTKYFAKAFASKIESTEDISEATQYTFEKIVEDEITYFAIKSGDNYLGWSSSTNFSTNNAEPVKFLPTAGEHGTWRLKVEATLSESTVRSIVYRAGTTNKFAPYGISNINGTEYYDVEIGSGADMTDYMTTCCEAKAITIASPIANGSVSADLAEACEGKTVTLTPTADPAYYFDAWDVYKTGESATKVTVTSNQFTMPAYAVTVSASFVHDACVNLDAPTLNGTIEPTYNSATIAWNEVTGAVAYAVTITNHTTSDVVFSGNVTELSKALTGLDPETQYDYSVMAVGDGMDKCADGNGLLEDNFTTAALPTVQLYYVKKQGADPIDGGTHTLGVEFDLVPSDLSCTKTFVGWTDEANKDYTHATEAPSVLLNKYTFTSEAAVTLYAVYAEVGPGTTTYTLTHATSVEEGVYVIAAYDENYKALTGGISAGKLVNETTGFTIDGENKIGSLPDDACEFTFTAVTGGYSIQKPNDDYLGYTSTSDNNKLAFGTYATLVWSVNSNSKEGYPDGGVSLTTSAYKVSANASAGSDTWVRGYKSSGSIYNPIYLFKKTTAAGTATNYATTCADAPVATPDPASIDAAAAGTSGTITMVYDNVNTSALAVALYNDAEGNVAFTGDWLTASLSSTNISYTVNPNTTYAARTAYIKLTAPETTGATDPAVVIIPVTQAKYIPEFASLAALVTADPAIPSGTDVKVSFSHIKISDDIAIISSQRKGVYLDQKAANDKDIEIYYAASPYVPAGWVKNGFVSATDLVATWTYYNQYSNDQWELVPVSGFSWEDDLVYEAPSAAQISVSPTGDVVFTGVDRGITVADKELTVTLTNVASAKAELTGATSVFGIDNETPATGEKIKISVDTDVEPNTYAAVLTISDDADEAEDVVINISITISAAETAVSTTSEWIAATEIVDGMQVLIVTTDGTDVFAMGANRGNNRGVVEASVDEDVLTPGEGTMAFTLVAQDGGTFALRASNGKYLYAGGTGTSNWLNTKAYSDELDANAKWNIDLGASTIIATSSNRNDMRFNKGNNPPIISCYQSTSSTTTYPRVALYVPKQDTPVEPTSEDVRTGLEINRYYTICLGKDVTAATGATFWNLFHKNAEPATEVYLEETQLPLEAGKPYIFQATATTLNVTYGDETAAAGTNGALVGTLTGLDVEAFEGLTGNIYILKDNAIHPRMAGNWLSANRAYINYDELTIGTPQPAPGRRVRAVPMQGQTATGCENIQAGEAPVKMMIDGQLYILRGEKMYDVTGKLVK